MPRDNELVDCVGRDKVTEICNKLCCMLRVSCLSHNGNIELCKECFDEIERLYPECIEATKP